MFKNSIILLITCIFCMGLFTGCEEEEQSLSPAALGDIVGVVSEGMLDDIQTVLNSGVWELLKNPVIEGSEASAIGLELMWDRLPL